MPKFDWLTSETILGGIAVLGVMMIAMKKVLSVFGLDIVRKNANEIALTVNRHESEIQALFGIAHVNSENIQYIRGRIDEALKK